MPVHAYVPVPVQTDYKSLNIAFQPFMQLLRLLADLLNKSVDLSYIVRVKASLLVSLVIIAFSGLLNSLSRFTFKHFYETAS